MEGVRATLKRLAEGTLRRSGLPARRIRRRSSGTVILSYHNIVPHGEAAAGDRSLHLAQPLFAAHLDRLAETHDVVPLSALQPGEAATGRPRAVLTFDDAYRGTLIAGVEEVARREMPATVFVPPALLGSEGFWWDLLADPRRGLDPRLRDHAMARLGGRQEAVLSHAGAEGHRAAPLPDHARPVDPNELRAVVTATPLLTLGSHSWSHANLAGVPLDEAREEMVHGHRWLREQGWLHDPEPRAAEWLAYPYGHSTPEVEEAARAIVRGAVRVEGGAAEVAGRWVAAAHRLPRVNIPAGLTPDGLTLRLAGLR